MGRHHLSPCVMIIALQVTESPQEKENHFAAMIASHVHEERSQIRQVRETVKDTGCPPSLRYHTQFPNHV